jgi:hypothetical protein
VLKASRKAVRPKPRPEIASAERDHTNGKIAKTNAIIITASVTGGIVSASSPVLITAILSGTVPNKKKSTDGILVSNLELSVFDLSMVIASKKAVGRIRRSISVIGKR